MTEEGNKNVYVESRALGGFRMSDHSQSPATLEKINERDWDYIILQGNSALISQEKWHYLFLPYLKEMKRIIKTNNKSTCIIYMMPWAYLDGLAWIPGETDTYEEMQHNIYTQTITIMKKIDMSTAPAGWVWKTAIDQGFNEDLYLNDFNHQGFAGAYLTACVFYATLFYEPAPQINIDLEDPQVQNHFPELSYDIVINNLDIWNIY
jgi:hypothetical protein